MDDTQTPDESDPKEVFADVDPVRILIAHDLLKSAGIKAFVFDQESSRILGTTPAVPIRLMVLKEQAKQAFKALKELGFQD
jgi:hypothetical protein